MHYFSRYTHSKIKKYSKKHAKIFSIILLTVILSLAWRTYQVNLNYSILIIENKIHKTGLNVEELPKAPYKWVDELPWKSTGYKERVYMDSIEELIEYANDVGVKTIHRSGSEFYVFCTNRCPRIYCAQVLSLIP